MSSIGDAAAATRSGNPSAPSSGAGIEWANSAGGYPIAASVYGAVGNVLTLQTELTW